MTTKQKKPIKIALMRLDDVTEFGYPKLLVETPYGVLELRLYSKHRAHIKTKNSPTKDVLTINNVEYDGSCVFTDGTSEEDYYECHVGPRSLPADAGDWAFRYKSGHFNISRADWLENPNVKYGTISDAARGKIYSLIPAIMAEALEQFPTLLEEAELANAKDHLARAHLDTEAAEAVVVAKKTAQLKLYFAARKAEKALAEAKA